jgi:hypothetical protein
VREEASAHLEALGGCGEAALHRAWETTGNPEVKTRLETLLSGIRTARYNPMKGGPELQAIRAVQALEYMGDEHARAALAAAAEHNGSLLVRKEAAEAVSRLEVLDRARREEPEKEE